MASFCVTVIARRTASRDLLSSRGDVLSGFFRAVARDRDPLCGFPPVGWMLGRLHPLAMGNHAVVNLRVCLQT